MLSTAKKSAPEPRQNETGPVWPVLVGTAALLALLPLRSGLATLLRFPSAPPYWELSRAAGLLAYLCLWLAAVSGATNRLPLPAWLRPLLLDAHQWGAVWAAYVGLFHAAVLLWDRYIQFTWRDLLVPFAASYKPVLVGMGSLALYGLVTVLLITYFRAYLSATVWRWTHALSYPAYALALWHGVALGTDSALTWVQAFYIGTSAALVLLMIIRLTYQPARPSGAPTRSTPAG